MYRCQVSTPILSQQVAAYSPKGQNSVLNVFADDYIITSFAIMFLHQFVKGIAACVEESQECVSSF